ncbi:LLM class flavin-dependent oxidoreductase [Microbacterium rhizomatis]|uniref:LLM class flavin-dependent oxidoreductase n=1 Tax=Microbacterium rhizomatis TaxID=1631477 RepID=A0A5J5J271_9MICO|nr:LLM class flavin-dependent oxidoreductase [Microbacterium rhizomatis]KAA9106378.1 LLM class flavin-dependent oxidoreductase [Microbacterium rhizomatis]
MSTSSLGLHWYLPTAGESRDTLRGGTNVYPVDGEPAGAPFRRPSLSYLTQVALAVEEAGFDSVLIPTGSYCEDPWIVAAALAGVTRDLRFLVAQHPRTTTPAYAAHRAATLQRLSGDRLALNVVTGEPGAEAWLHGDFGDKEDQYARTGEFLDIYGALFRGETVNRDGRHYRVRDGKLARPRSGDGLPPAPEVWFGGSSEYAGTVAAAHADVYLSWLEPLDQLAEKVEWIRSLAAAQGRTVRFGVRSWILVRDTDAEAERAALALLDGATPEQLAQSRTQLLSRQSVGQQRGQAHLNDADLRRPDSLWIAPNVWGGFGLVAGGPALGFVGGFDHVADRFAEYARVGISEFIVSGFPNLEETRWVADGLVGALSRTALSRRTESRVPVDA